jgi:sulfite reductase beta subunit-like hemoprotein
MPKRSVSMALQPDFRASTRHAILAALRPLLIRYAAERKVGESFGDFVVRIGAVPPMPHGRDFNVVAKDVA